jgi:hypothetical protein
MQKEIASQIILSHLMRLTVNTNEDECKSNKDVDHSTEGRT